MLKDNDYPEFTKHLKAVWKQLRFHKKTDKTTSEVLHEPVICDEDYLKGIQNHNHGALQLCPQGEHHYLHNSETMSDEYDYF